MILVIAGSAVAVTADTFVTLDGFSFYKNTKGEAVIVGCDDSVTSMALPAALMNAPVAEIADNAFFGSVSLREVSFESAVALRRIGSNAFCGCTALASATLPALEELGFGAFQGCTGLKSLSIDEGLARIPAQAFYRCEKLEEASIPTSVTAIGDYAFGGCAALTALTVPDSVTVISDSAFDGCDALVIYCSTDSYAHRYAQTNGLSYELTDEPQALIRGDADGDGKVTILDATCIQRYLVSLPVASFIQQAADVDGDGVNILDATHIQRYLAGFRNTYGIGE